MATIAEPFEHGISVGRVLQRTLATVLHNPVATVATALLLAGIPATIFELLLSNIRPEYLVLTIAGYPLPGALALFGIEWFASQIFGVFTQGAMITAVVAEHEARRASLAAALLAALRCFIPLLALGALIGIGVVMGTVLLIVPAMVVFTLWSVAPSAVTQGRDGFFLALNRSQELGEGARAKTFGIILIAFLAGTIVSIAGNFLGRLDGVSLARANLSVGYVLTAAAVGTLANLIWSTTLASLYVELRDWKEGSSVGSLQEVFA